MTAYKRPFRLWFSRDNWGLVNLSWGYDGKWALHLLVSHRDQWHWGRDDNEYAFVLTYWGLGPIGFVSRDNTCP